MYVIVRNETNLHNENILMSNLHLLSDSIKALPTSLTIEDFCQIILDGLAQTINFGDEDTGGNFYRKKRWYYKLILN